MELGVALPPQLRALYAEANSFREPKGNAQYLFPLSQGEDGTTLMEMTRFWWNEWPKMRSFIFLGSSSCDYNWAIRHQEPHDVIAYHHNMGDEFETAGQDLIEVFKSDFAEYDALE